MRHYIWTFIWAIFILTLFSMPVRNTGDIPTFEGIDKLIHTGFFFVLSVLLFHASSQANQTRKPSFLVLIRVLFFSVGFAVLTEFLQWKVFTYRSADIWDLFANITGIGMGTFAYLLLHRTAS